MEDNESPAEWHVVSSSGQDPPGLGARRWNLAQLFALAGGSALDDLFVHAVERKSDGAQALALMADLDQLAFLPPETRDALEALGLERLPLAVIAGSPDEFAAEWNDKGQVPDG